MYFINLSLSYERIFNSGKTSLKIPLSVGLGGPPDKEEYDAEDMDMYYRNRNYAAGLEFNVYPFGQRRGTLYVGVSAQVGAFGYYREVHDTIFTPNSSSPSGGSHTYPLLAIEKHNGSHYSGMLHVGGYLGVSEHFLIGTKMGLGFKRDDTVYDDFTMFTGQFDINLAYRF